MQDVDVNTVTNDSNTQEVDGLSRGLDELNITDKIHINMEGKEASRYTALHL